MLQLIIALTFHLQQFFEWTFASHWFLSIGVLFLTEYAKIDAKWFRLMDVSGVFEKVQLNLNHR